MSARAALERLGLALGIGIIAATRTDRGRGRNALAAQVRLSETGETHDDLPVVGLYGVSSRPRPGADAVILCLGGNRGPGVVIGTGDGRFTVELKEGEVAMHTHDGTVVHARIGQPLLLKCPHGVVIEGPSLTHNGRDIGETHRHRDVTPGGGTSGEPVG